jgi:hypothetical protein
MPAWALIVIGLVAFVGFLALRWRHIKFPWLVKRFCPHCQAELPTWGVGSAQAAVQRTPGSARRTPSLADGT